MTAEPPDLLRIFLLGSLEFDEALHLQKTLAFQLSGDRSRPALLLCEHPTLITVGRHGSPAQIQADPEELAARRWEVRWVQRGGGTLLHLPGQLAVYPVFALDRLGLNVGEYLERLQEVVIGVLGDFGIVGRPREDQTGVLVENRLVAAVGVSVYDWISTFGVVLNVDPDLTLYRLVQTGGEAPMTSVARERRGPVSPALVRQRVIEHLTQRFGFTQTDLVFHGPGRPGHQRLCLPS